MYAVSHVDINTPVSKGICEHGGIHEAEQCWGQDAALFDPGFSFEWVRRAFAVLKSGLHLGTVEPA
ncbi:hypothetical protein DPMN_129307 [Dreissena polymorpha]|uniref:Uncharacterized protein n=1 Tax=Dreissena polymorpha TaxID=45954 RepID=A0A9D4H0Z3_DREPO|nr:hypothetical protein DPMN_129307 [Dreissena polymorpha]